MAAFDSHNYDPTDNDLEEQALRARKRSSYHAEEKWKWGMSVIIGIAMGFIAFVVDGLIDKLNAFKFGSTTGLIASRVAAFPTWLTFVSIAALYSFVAGGMVSYVAPLAAGSGIPELKTYLNGVHLKGLLRLRTIVAKLGGIAFSIGSGLIAGKEGPFVHGGGLVGGGLSAFGSHSLGFKARKPSHFRDGASKRDRRHRNSHGRRRRVRRPHRRRPLHRRRGPAFTAAGCCGADFSPRAWGCSRRTG